jgi:hypothetical protein
MSSLGPISDGVTRYLRRYLVMSEISSRLMLRCRRTLFHRPPLLLHDGGGCGGGDVDHALLTSHVVKKIPFPLRCVHVSPPPALQSQKYPPSARAPLPPTFIRRRVMHVSPGEGWGGGQWQCKGAEERDKMAMMTTTTTTLPLPQTERATSACTVEP